MTVFFLTLSFFPLFSNVSSMHNSGNSNKRHVFSFRLIRNMVQVSLLHHLYPVLHRTLLRLKCFDLGVYDPQLMEYQLFFFKKYFKSLHVSFRMMQWEYLHDVVSLSLQTSEGPQKSLERIKFYAASLKRTRSITRNTFSCVHLAGGGKIPILRVPGDIRVNARAFEASVRVLAVVKGHAVNTQHVGLQVPFLRGAVRAVAALEWPLTSMTWERNQ